jgi:hypothetical protein
MQQVIDIDSELLARTRRWHRANYNGDGWDNDPEHDLLVELVDVILRAVDGSVPDYEDDTPRGVYSTTPVPDVAGRDLSRPATVSAS